MTDNEYFEAISSLAIAYNKTLEKIIRGVGDNIDLNDPRTAHIIRQANQELDKLRALTKKWGVKYIPALYKDIQKDTEK